MSLLFFLTAVVFLLLVALSLRSFSLLGVKLRTVIDEGGGNERAYNKGLIDKLRATRHYMVASSRAIGVILLTSVARLLFKPDHKYEGSSRAAILAVIDLIELTTVLVCVRLHAAYISEPFRERARQRHQVPVFRHQVRETRAVRPVRP